jgi:polysaccharide export outer membrane protein
MLRSLHVALLLALLAGCSGSPPAPRNLPAPILSTTLGPGDVLEITVVGEKELPKEFKINGDGTLDFPYVKRIKAGGMEPQELSEELKKMLREGQILKDPQLTLIVKSYASKKVSVIGQVNKPGSVPWTDGVKLVDVVVQSGGFTSIADSKHVILTRQTSPGKSVTVVVSVDAITDGDQPDIPLQAGDTIKVDARVF